MEFWYQQRCGWAINKFNEILQKIQQIANDSRNKKKWWKYKNMLFNGLWRKLKSRKLENLKKQIKVPSKRFNGFHILFSVRLVSLPSWGNGVFIFWFSTLVGFVSSLRFLETNLKLVFECFMKNFGCLRFMSTFDVFS